LAWLDRQLDAIAYLREEVRVLREATRSPPAALHRCPEETIGVEGKSARLEASRGDYTISSPETLAGTETSSKELKNQASMVRGKSRPDRPPESETCATASRKRVRRSPR
jgi:hypothetical protein